jgi:hypothetical protein
VDEKKIRARIEELKKESQGLLLEANVRHGGAMELERLLAAMAEQAAIPTAPHIVKDEEPPST